MKGLGKLMKPNEIPNHDLLKRDCSILLNENVRFRAMVEKTEERYNHHMKELKEEVFAIIDQLEKERDSHIKKSLKLKKQHFRLDDIEITALDNRVNGLQYSINRFKKIKALFLLYGI